MNEWFRFMGVWGGLLRHLFKSRLILFNIIRPFLVSFSFNTRKTSLYGLQMFNLIECDRFFVVYILILIDTLKS